MEKVELLTKEERAQLPAILMRRNKFRQMLKVTLQNYDKIYSNLLIIAGSAGCGKTSITEELLDTMKSEEQIYDYTRVSGHLSPLSLYKLLDQTANPGKNGKANVLMMDDTDVLSDGGCLELLKAGFDSKNPSLPTNRKVFYMTQDGAGRNSFKYNGFGIMITNNTFNPDKISTHMQAVLDRAQMLSVDLKADDCTIFTTSLIEDYLNKNEDKLTDAEITSIVDLFNKDIRRWIKTDAFRNSKTYYSIRLLKKMVDAQRLYGDDWRDFSIPYIKLNTAAELAELSEGKEVEIKDLGHKRVAVKKTSKKNDKYMINKNGEVCPAGEPNHPYNKYYQTLLKKKGLVA